MSRLTRTAVASACGALVLALVAPRVAQAYSVRVHIHLANAIRDDLVKNMKDKGKPLLRVLGPDGSEAKFVELLKEDAEAIRDFPEFFRAGAIGPDNTVLTGLTDPSHAWMFSPFSQCQTLLDASSMPEERAYALGCFLHGISDNAAHHVVNFFTGETFTLYPKDAAENGQLEFSMLNVVRHIVVEGKFEDSLGKALPQEFNPDRLAHRIPIDLVRRVYFEDDGGQHGLWRLFAGHLVQKKNDALRAAQLNGFDPVKHLGMSIEEIRQNGVAIDLNGEVLQAYIDFLSSGGAIVGVAAGEMTPADYVLFLPEIVADIKRLLAITITTGEKKLADTRAEWEAMGKCTIFCPLLNLRKQLFEHLFDKASNDGQASRMQQAVDRKNGELDKIIDSYLLSVEKLSNAVVTKGFPNLGPLDIASAIQPFASAISDVVDFPYDILFPQTFVDIIEHFDGLQTFLKKSFILIAQVITDQILARIKTYLDTIRMSIAQLRDQALAHVGIRVDELREELGKALDAAKLSAVGLDIDSDADLFANFPKSVLYMNTYNSIVGALGNQLVVAPHEVVPGFFSGPVSFDASYQLTYNQLALCDKLSPVFYPCGITATEMLQPDFARCQKLDKVALPDSTIECHRADATRFLDDPDVDACARTMLDELIAPTDGHIGSYSLAYPASMAATPPMCINPPIVGINADGFGDKADCMGGDCTADYGQGCGCSNTSGRRSTLPVIGLVFGLLVVTRRRRRR